MCTAVFAPKIALLTSPAAFSAGMESQGDKRRAGQGTRARAEKDQLAQRKAERRALAAVLSGNKTGRAIRLTKCAAACRCYGDE